MKARLPKKGKAVTLEDCIKSEFRKFVNEHGKENMFEIFNYMLSRKYIDSFDYTSSMDVKKEVNKLIGEPFKEELEMAWKRSADEGKNAEEILQEMSSGTYIEENLGKNIPKAVKEVLDRELLRYIKLKKEALEEEKNKDKVDVEVNDSLSSDKKEENVQDEPITKTEESANPVSEEIVEDGSKVKLEEKIENEEGSLEVNDEENEPKMPRKSGEVQIDNASKWNEADIEFYKKTYAFTNGFKSLVKPGYMYDVEYGRRSNTSFDNFKQYNRFLRIQEIVKLARSKYKMNEYQAIKELLKRKSKKIDPVTRKILEKTVESMGKNENEVNKKYESDIDM